MTNPLDLHETQETTLPKIKVVSEHEPASGASRLGVVVGSQKLLIHLTDISEVLPVPPLQAVPLTKHWFLGVANVRGNLYSVTDLAQFLGLPQTQRQVGNRIVLLNSVKTTQAALLIDGVIGLRSIETMQLINASTNENAAFFTSQIYQDVDNTEWFTLDVDTLVQDSKFIQPSLS